MLDPVVPDRPLERFLEILDALLEDKRWYEPVFSLRFAATSLMTLPGDAQDIVTRLRETAEELKEGARWLSPLKTEVRHVIAAMLLRSEMSPSLFHLEVERVEGLFKEHKLSRGSTVSQLAALLLIDRRGAAGHKVGSSDVQRMAEIWAEMKTHHRFLTGSDDYPSCALLAGLDGAPSEIAARCEVFYDGLRKLGFSRGNPLQTVSHLLMLAPSDSNVLMQRFKSLWKAFDEAGLWMNTGDYDELACLSFLDRTTSAVVKKVSDHRKLLRAHKPAPEKQLSFSLACSTAFVELAGESASHKALADAQRVLAVHAIIVAQQVAMMAAASSASAAAAASN